MSKRDWGYNFALGLGVVAVVAFFAYALVDHSKQRERRDKGPQQHSEHALDGVERAGIPVVPGLQTPPRKPNPERDEWRQENDLEAQWEQAKWAKYAAFAGFLGALVTGVGIWFVRQTLKATRDTLAVTAKSADAASKQAEAALEANKLAQQAYAADQRPWLTFLEIKLVSDVEYTSDGRASFTIEFRFQNTGRTPALHVMVETLVFSMGPHNPNKIGSSERAFAEKVRSSGNRFGNLIGPGRVFRLQATVSITKEEIDAIRSGDLKMLAPIVIGCIRYRPTFSEETFVTSETLALYRDRNKALPLEGANVPQSELSLISMPFLSGHAT